jgi:hypothetical protein
MVYIERPGRFRWDYTHGKTPGRRARRYPGDVAEL